MPYQSKSSVFPTILPIAGGRIVGFIPFPRILAVCEMQTNSSRIWTLVSTSISYVVSSVVNSSIRPIVGTLTGTPIPDQSGPGSNSHKGTVDES